MDTISALSQQWKERENKLFSQKAEVHAKEMKEMTGMPKIDPLSKKIAEIITRREMEALGIQPVDPPIKKPAKSAVLAKGTPRKNSISKDSPEKHSKKQSEPKSEPKQNKSPEIIAKKPSIRELPHKNEIEFKEKTQVSDNFIKRDEEMMPEIKITKEHSKKSSNVLENENKEQETIDERNKSDDMLHNVAHLQAFQDELQREYPELGLNNSMEGSSFHTNELDELEEACKNLSLENNEKNDQNEENIPENKEIISENVNEIEKNQEGLNEIHKNQENLQSNLNKTEPNNNNHEEKNLKLDQGEEKTDQFENQNDEKKNSTDDISNKSDCGESSNYKSRLNFPNKGNEEQGLPTIKLVSSNSENQISAKAPIFSTVTNSKFLATHFSQDSLPKDLSNFQKSFVKASFLHCPQERIPKTVPRCHITLPNCKSSPIYFNVRTDRACRFKHDKGLALVDSLRRLLIDPPQIPKPTNRDFYTKNIDWLKIRNEKINEFRETVKDKDIQGCTFDPYYEKHEEIRKKKQKNTFKFRAFTVEAKKKKNTEFKPKVPENIIKYSSLSPSDCLVRYAEGFPLEKFIQKAKPLVPYRSINLLT